MLEMYLRLTHDCVLENPPHFIHFSLIMLYGVSYDEKLILWRKSLMSKVVTILPVLNMERVMGI
jgi:hypothetical protein